MVHSWGLLKLWDLNERKLTATQTDLSVPNLPNSSSCGISPNLSLGSVRVKTFKADMTL